ncbi:MAG: polysaccharide deacetylase family protein [Negativicutes bacterium]|nr:polysaccharide deacetylase family protein [Negativicutes bacterium]
MRLRKWCMAILAAISLGLVLQLAAGHKGVREVATQEKVVALTFDDGPDAQTTPRILQVLAAYQAKATFFVLGRRAEELPQQLAEIAAAGHEIGNHGFSHKWLTGLSDREIVEEIARTEAAIMAAAPRPTLFRPPGAYYDERVIGLLKERGYVMTMWSIDSRDWSNPAPQRLARELADKVRPGAIILLHDGAYAPGTPQAVSLLLEALREQGYRFVTVSELFSYSEAAR